MTRQHFIPSHGGYKHLLEQDFIKEGGLRERMTRVRLASRSGRRHS